MFATALIVGATAAVFVTTEKPVSAQLVWL
jgi:hypothetical protein